MLVYSKTDAKLMLLFLSKTKIIIVTSKNKVLVT